MKKIKQIIVGGAGFIGSNLIKKLLGQGGPIYVLDNFSNSSPELVADYLAGEFVQKVDVSRCNDLREVFQKILQRSDRYDIWHLAANSDIPSGVMDPDVDYRDTFLTTYNLLKVARDFPLVNSFNFASSSAIYGDMGGDKIQENAGPLLPISNYGAMKLASEAALSAAHESFLPAVNIFRFPNIVGSPATHGVIFDFVQKLKKNPARLDVLGNGEQKKSYLYIDDLIEAMLHIHRINLKLNRHLSFFNIGPLDEGVTVRQIAETVVSIVSPDAEIFYGHGNKGWVGDIPKFSYSIDRLLSTGWMPSFTSLAAVERATFDIKLQLLNLDHNTLFLS